ncbi:Hypothetical predicted protein [Octopus vulgaris]|uniref:Uncharacterized protein n=1 Tax=Octopus vulgaris TaxID=6645 RepID=A0AA36AQV8_OCTVU|nr:Hypothetical predicted protein [Octopus vulgaris]
MSLFTTQTVNARRTLEASYEISLLVVKCGEKRTIEEDLIKPSISAFLKTVLEKHDRVVQAMPLSNNTVSRRMDEMSEDIETQLVEKLKSKKFSLQMDESTLRNREVVLLTYARYIDKGEFAEEMIFCKSLESTTTTTDMHMIHWLKKCEVTDAAVLVFVDHLKILASDLKESFSDLKQIDFPTWMMQPILVDISDVSIEYQEELSEMQNDESMKTLFNIKGMMSWLCDEIETKYPNSTNFARKLLLPFRSSYLSKCGFSAVNDLLLKKRNRLDISKRGDTRLKLTKLVATIKSLNSRHEAQGSH